MICPHKSKCMSPVSSMQLFSATNYSTLFIFAQMEWKASVGQQSTVDWALQVI